MFNKLAGKILFRWFHFTETITEPLPEKCIIALAPHTSNWETGTSLSATSTVGPKASIVTS